MTNEIRVNAMMPMFTVSVQARVIQTMALRFFKGAIESYNSLKLIDGDSENEKIQKEMFAASCLMLTAAGLEAFINELFLERHGPVWQELSKNDSDPQHQFEKECNHVKLPKFNNKKTSIDYLSPVKKYQFGSDLLEIKEQISDEEWDSLELIFLIRHALVHFQPCYGDERKVDRNRKDLRVLIGNRFVIGHGDTLTDGCLTIPCIQWVTTTAFEFVKKFCVLAQLNEIKTGHFDSLTIE